MGEMKFVFISHSNKQPDAQICERLYRHLSANGICCWMDREDMHHGSWEDQIVEKLLDAAAFILVESENSLTSKEVRKEVRNMTKTERPLLLFALDNFGQGQDKRMGSNLLELGPGSYQKIFLHDYDTEEIAFDKLISELPRDITRLKNNAADFDDEGGVLKKYTGDDSFVEIPSYISEIGDEAFKKNHSLVSVKIPDSVTKIGKRAFFGCNALSRVDGMNKVTEADNSSFGYTAVLPREHKGFALNGILFGDENDDGKFPEAEVVAQNSFYGCTAEEIEFKEGLKIVGAGAFTDCFKLKRIIFPSTLEYIGENAFLRCNKLQEVVFKGTPVANAGEIFKQAKITEEK